MKNHLIFEINYHLSNTFSLYQLGVKYEPIQFDSHFFLTFFKWNTLDMVGQWYKLSNWLFHICISMLAFMGWIAGRHSLCICMIWSIFHFMLNSKQLLYEVTRLVTGEKHLLTKLPATAGGQTSGMHEVKTLIKS